jgi:hypothetical protein
LVLLLLNRERRWRIRWTSAPGRHEYRGPRLPPSREDPDSYLPQTDHLSLVAFGHSGDECPGRCSRHGGRPQRTHSDVPQVQGTFRVCPPGRSRDLDGHEPSQRDGRTLLPLPVGFDVHEARLLLQHRLTALTGVDLTSTSSLPAQSWRLADDADGLGAMATLAAFPKMLELGRRREGLRICRAAWLLGVTVREYREFEAGDASPSSRCTNGCARCSAGRRRGGRRS